LIKFRSSPDTTLSRYDISWMPSYVSLPPCSLSTCRISALTLCWISGCSASSYRAKVSVLAEVSYPAIRKVNACATNKSPSISENKNNVLLQYRCSLFLLVTWKCSFERPYFCGSESNVWCGFTRMFLHGYDVCLMTLYLLSWYKNIQFHHKRTFHSHNLNLNTKSYQNTLIFIGLINILFL